MTRFGIHTASHHLNVLDGLLTDLNGFKWYLFYRWAVDTNWNGGKPPTFAGRYFLRSKHGVRYPAGVSTPEFAVSDLFQWGHGEGSSVNKTIKSQWQLLGPLGDADVTPLERIAAIQSPDSDRQSGLGPDAQSGIGYLNGLADGTALCHRVAACIAAEELSVTDSFVYLFLDVATGTALSTWYWAAWAHAVYTFTLFGRPRPTQPFLPALCCDFLEDSTTNRYALDPQVARCLDTAQLQHRRLAARCWGFWAKATSRANLTQPLDFSRFPDYRQPMTSTESQPVSLLVWRYAEQAAEFDPGFVGGNWISLDAVNDDRVLYGMLRIEEWSAAELHDRQPAGGVARPPLYMGVDRATPFTLNENDPLPDPSVIACLAKRDPASGLRLHLSEIRDPPDPPLPNPPRRPPWAPPAVNIPFSGSLDFVMRYYAPPPGPTATLDKRLTDDELVALKDAGLRIGMFWQVGWSDWIDRGHFDPLKNPGYRHALAAFKLAAHFNQPPHTPIYFAPHDQDSEEDPEAREFAERYFKAVRLGYEQYVRDARVAGLDPRPYEIGVWGGNVLLDYCYAQGIVSHFFQGCSEGWNRYGNAKVWAHINALQVTCRGTLCCKTIVDVDASWGDEGAWEPEP